VKFRIHRLQHGRWHGKIVYLGAKTFLTSTKAFTFRIKR